MTGAYAVPPYKNRLRGRVYEKIVHHPRIHRSGTARLCRIRPISHFSTIYYSLFDWSGIDSGATFAGLSNYIGILSDDVFWLSLKNNLLLVVASLLTQLPLGPHSGSAFVFPDPGGCAFSAPSIFFPC